MTKNEKENVKRWNKEIGKSLAKQDESWDALLTIAKENGLRPICSPNLLICEIVSSSVEQPIKDMAIRYFALYEQHKGKLESLEMFLQECGNVF